SSGLQSYFRGTLGADGIQLGTPVDNLPGPPAEFVRAAGSVIGADGTVVDAHTGTIKGRLTPFPTIGDVAIPTLVCAEPDGSRAYALPKLSTIYTLSHDLSTLSFVGQADTGIGADVATGAFQRWGVDGFAFLSPGGLWLYRSPLVAANPSDDWDGDGLPDNWEQANGTNPHVNDASRDLDGDGLNNAGEFEAGTLANDASSRFELRLNPAPGGGWQGEFQARGGRRYQLESGRSAAGPWEPLGDVISGAEGWVVLPLPGGVTTQLFRVALAGR
ncbi:MAG TPA: hypothetical protein PLX89_21685, partial [Verrucomicrobiota bacterium]|nr:hypothetical protein [Verrucomicrobiota bacterium]